MKLVAVFLDDFFVVPGGETEVEDFFAVEIGMAAATRAETVNEPRKFAELGGLNDLQTARFFYGPLAVGDGSDGGRRVGALTNDAVAGGCFSGVHRVPV